jgi:hypothetical protein
MSKRWAMAVSMALGAMMMHGSVAVAYLPAEGDRVFAGDNVNQKYHFATDPPTPQWLKSAFNDAAVDFTAVENNTRAPKFNLLEDAGFGVFYRHRNATDDTEDCPPEVNWRACIEFHESPWAIAYITFHTGTNWCEKTGDDSDCYYLRRTSLHELGHGAGLFWGPNDGHYDPADVPSSVSVMGSSSTAYLAPAGGSNPPGLGRCDLMELAREYDLDSMTDPVPDCEEDLPASVLTGGDITTVLTHSASASFVCVGATVTLSGSLRLINEAADSELGLLADNPLAGRTVSVYRKAPGGTYAFLKSDATGGIGAWSTTVTYTSSTTYVFQARYSPGSTDDFILAADSSFERTVEWSSAC